MIAVFDGFTTNIIDERKISFLGPVIEAEGKTHIINLVVDGTLLTLEFRPKTDENGEPDSYGADNAVKAHSGIVKSLLGAKVPPTKN